MVGDSLSGQDISMELVDIAKEVHLSAKSLDNISEGLSKVISKYEKLHLHPQVGISHFELIASFFPKTVESNVKVRVYFDKQPYNVIVH